MSSEDVKENPLFEERERPIEYTGIWPFRKVKKPTQIEMLMQLMEIAFDEIQNSIESLKECIDKKLSDGTVAKASMDEIRKRFEFTEGICNKLIDNGARRRIKDEDDEEREKKNKPGLSYDERERQRKLAEKLKAKHANSNSNGPNLP